MTVRPLEGTEPFSASNGPGGVLVLHGFTGSPASVRSLAEAFADAALSVELPLLPGHATSPADLATTCFDDWADAAERSYLSLQARTDRLAVAGLSMGGTLALWLAERHPELAGLVLVNPFVEPLDPESEQVLRGEVAAGRSTFASPGSDIAKPGVDGGSYDETPLLPLLSLLQASAAVARDLGGISCPVLLLSSRTDHVVPCSSSDLVERTVSGPLERVVLEGSFHVATLDHDGPEIEERAVAFVQKLMAA